MTIVATALVSTDVIAIEFSRAGRTNLQLHTLDGSGLRFHRNACGIRLKRASLRPMSWRNHWLTLLALIAALSFLTPAHAEEVTGVPPELQPWVPWVLAESPERECVTVAGAKACLYHGQLVLSLTDSGGTFEQRFHADAETNVTLPGSTLQWPEGVTVDGKPAVVLEGSDGTPVARVSKGTHAVRGRFSWLALPDVLRIAPGVANVSLTLNGKQVTGARREPAETLWIQNAPGASQASDSLVVDAFRKFSDGVPVFITTEIRLRASGKRRELNLGHVLLEGSTAISTTGDLPSHLSPQGELVVQLSAGTHKVEILARGEPSQASWALTTRPAPWPEQEVWVWAPDARLREVEVGGLSAVDPGRTELDPSWKTLRAFAATPGQALTLRTTRRGDGQPPPNALTLSREFWLDLDGKGFTVRDKFTGKLERESRLSLLSGELGHVAMGATDELITQDADGRGRGVEIRQAAVDLVAESRMSRAGLLSAVGWSSDVDSLGLTLHLPPGWKLLATSGVDEASGSWVESWNLFEFFYTLLVAIAVAKLSKPHWGAIALVTLVVCHGEREAPYFLYAGILSCWALLRFLTGRLRSVVRVAYLGMLIVLAFVVVTFGQQQIKMALFPQLDHSAMGGFSDEGQSRVAPARQKELKPEEPLAASPPPPAGGVSPSPSSQVDDAAYGGSTGKMKSLGALSSSATPQSAAHGENMKQDAGAVIQTGPGVPTWAWSQTQLQWNGPVRKDHEARLILLSPAVNSVVAVLRLVGALLLGYVFFRMAPFRGGPVGPAGPSTGTSRGAKGASTDPAPTHPAATDPATPMSRALVVTTFMALLLWPAQALAEPTREMLDALEQRLNTPAPCGQQCISVERADLQIGDSALTVALDVHAGAPGVVRLPGPLTAFGFSEVVVDGAASEKVLLHADGFVYLRLDAGIHRVVLSGPIVTDEVTLAMPDRPKSARASGQGWAVDGIRSDGRTDGSVRITRSLPRDTAAQGPSGLPAWFRIERRLLLGVTWQLVSTVTRVSPAETPEVVRVPLLKGERVNTADAQVEEGKLLISLGRDDVAFSWSSSLEETSPLRLEAPSRAAWAEVWQVDCSVIWQCAFSGLEPTTRFADGPGGATRQPQFHPWPGESLVVTAERPAPAPGEIATIDSVETTWRSGERLMDASMSVTLRNSTGALRALSLPEGAELRSFKVNGLERSIKREGTRIEVMLDPGSSTLEVSWQQPREGGVLTRTSAVDVGGPSANVRTEITLPHDRWLLWAHGPSWGPVIVFWIHLALIVLFGVIFARFPVATLSTPGWILLGLGLTQVPVAVAGCIAGWFFLLAGKEQVRFAKPLHHNLVQLGFVAATVIMLAMLCSAVYSGLLVQPDMQITGSGAYNGRLSWYVDRSASALPEAWVLAVPMWVYRVLMLVWSLWLASSLLGWLRRAWHAISAEALWRKA